MNNSLYEAADVAIVPEYPQGIMSGGTIVQAQETLEGLRLHASDLNCSSFYWDAPQAARLYHLVGWSAFMRCLAESLLRGRHPYLITLLLGNECSLSQRAKLWLKHQLAQLSRSNYTEYLLLKQSHRIIAITPRDADLAQGCYGLSSSHIEVVPNGVDEAFWSPPSEPWLEQFGKSPFVLCVGAIQKRKNQLILARACNRLSLPLVLLGPILPGENLYAEMVEEEMSHNYFLGGRWIKNLRRRDTLLLSAYACARVFVLLSSVETQPLSLMQAMAAGLPCLTSCASFTRCAPFSDLTTINPYRESALLDQLQKVWSETPSSHLHEKYSWRNSALQLAQIYRDALN